MRFLKARNIIDCVKSNESPRVLDFSWKLGYTLFDEIAYSKKKQTQEAKK